MKQFRRKLARVFGLALRSDLEMMNDAYNYESDESAHYHSESKRYQKLWRETQKGFDKYIRDHSHD